MSYYFIVNETSRRGKAKKIWKNLIKTFIREIILYNDKIIITYNFTSLTPIKTRDTMLKEVEDVECEINKQLDTAIKKW